MPRVRGNNLFKLRAALNGAVFLYLSEQQACKDDVKAVDTFSLIELFLGIHYNNALSNRTIILGSRYE